MKKKLSIEVAMMLAPEERSRINFNTMISLMEDFIDRQQAFLHKNLDEKDVKNMTRNLRKAIYIKKLFISKFEKNRDYWLYKKLIENHRI